MSRVIRFWKPYMVLSKFTDEEGRPTLADFIPVKDVYAAGRLDHDSEGLLLLTDDRRISTRLTEPQYAHPRQYLAQVDGLPDEQALQTLREGLRIKDYQTRPAEAVLLEAEPDLPPRPVPIRFRKDIPTAWIALTLTEGRNRQVRRMTAAVGHPTLRLVRAAIGPITLEGLDPGMWQDLSVEELRALQHSLGLRS